MNPQLIDLFWPASRHLSITPVFLPFMGCPARCVFCSQENQTGVSLKHKNPLPGLLRDCARVLRGRASPPELAFYGGTFTGINEKDWRLCLSFARAMLEKGLISGIRCSTRPDFLSIDRLSQLKDAGCGKLELGIQSFSNDSLAACGRHYDRESAIAGCKLASKFGFEVTAQLMPGMPRGSRASFLEDVRLAIDSGAVTLRFYPCLVLEGTGLASIWRQGHFTPMPLDDCVETLALGWLMAARAGARVTRMGLAPQAGLERKILAGPWHPALGSLVQGRALFLAAQDALESAHGRTISRLFLPAQAQGYFWGWRGSLKQEWRKLGIISDNVSWWNRELARMEIAR